MSLASNVTSLATRVATEVKSLRTLINGNVADLAALDTTAKTNLVAAINELAGSISTVASSVSSLDESTASEITFLNGALTDVQSDITALQSDLAGIDVSSQVAALINDGTTSTTSVWSSDKTSSEISTAVAALVDGAPALLDTLNELAAAIGDDANFVSTITTSLGTKAADNAVVKLTGAQTVAGVKTFSDAPVVPDASFAIAKVSGLQSALDAKASSANVGDTTTNYVTAFEAGLV